MQFCHAYDVPTLCRLIVQLREKNRLSKILGLRGPTPGIRPQQTDWAKFLALNFFSSRDAYATDMHSSAATCVRVGCARFF